MEPIIHTYGRLAGLIFACMVLCFLVAAARKRNDVADIAWGLGFLLIALATYDMVVFKPDKGMLITTLVSLWACRLAIHTYLQNWHTGEDYRHMTWREQWGRWVYGSAGMDWLAAGKGCKAGKTIMRIKNLQFPSNHIN